MYKLIRPFLFFMSADHAHSFVTFYMKNVLKFLPLKSLIRKKMFVTSKLMEQTINGTKYSNPVGIAAGFDKNAEMIDFLEMLGFGFIEIGSITNNPSNGNPKPRMIRLIKDRALINRCGLNNHGVKIIAERFSKIKEKRLIPIGVNIAKTHDPNILGDAGVGDYCSSFKTLDECGDYTVLNVSCPNTTEGKTFETPETLTKLLKKIDPPNAKKPIYLKVSPGLSDDEFKSVIEIAEGHGITGYIISNTSSDRSHLSDSEKIKAQNFGNGGLSGAPLKARTKELISKIYKMIPNERIIIACGGVETVDDVYELISRGAHLVQLYTSMIYEGPLLVRNINRALRLRLHNEGVSLSEIRGRL